MNKLALGVLLAGAIAACGGGKPTLIDAAVDAAVACNPVMQTGCQAGEKCTWIVDIDGVMNMKDIGHIGCISNGSIAEGGACNDATAMGGPDACVAGQLCVSRKCKPICDPQLVAGSAQGACSSDFSCSVYSGVFESGGDPTAGVCEPGCDPLTQRLKVGNLEACGSSNPVTPSATCVPSRGFLSFHCAPSGPPLYDKVDRVPPLTEPISGAPYGNGCAPGFIPFYFSDASGSNTTWCTGLCAPLKTDMVIAAQADHTTDNQGDKAVAAKLVADPMPVAGHATCAKMIKGATDVQSTRGEDCRFIWYPLAQGDPTKPSTSQYNDTLGVCFAYEKFLDITVPMMTQKLPEKSCTELPPTAPDTDPYGSAKENGCYPLAESKVLRKNTRRVVNWRLANGDGMALRHTFD